MERLNDREVMLSEEDWHRFTQHVQSRQRNGVPLPFPEELCQPKDSGNTVLRDDKEKKSRNKSSSSIKWKCFIRTVTVGCNRLILTFLPASFKYIRLMGRYGCSRSSSAGSSPRSPRNTAEMEPGRSTKESSSLGESKAQKLSVSLLSQGPVEGWFKINNVFYMKSKDKNSTIKFWAYSVQILFGYQKELYLLKMISLDLLRRILRMKGFCCS